MLPMGLGPKISAGERPKTYALDRAATGTGYNTQRLVVNYLPTFRDKPSLAPSRANKSFWDLMALEGTEKSCRNVYKELTTIYCVTSQKSADLTYVATQA
jgi:hypothetical protein